MSPALMKKYLEAARMVVDHLVLTPRGIRFAPHPVVTDTDRDKYCVKRIVEFYQRQPTDYADYFFAAWKYRHRAALGKPDATLKEIANEQQVSAKYLPHGLECADQTKSVDIGPLQTLQEMWNELPGPTHMTSRARPAHECVILSFRRESDSNRRLTTCTSKKFTRVRKRSCCGRTSNTPRIAAQPTLGFLTKTRAEPSGRCGSRSLHCRLRILLLHLSRCLLHFRTGP